MIDELIIIITISIILLLFLVCWYLNSTSITKMLEQEMALLSENIYDGKNEIITQDDIKEFPSLIQNYFKQWGIIGKERCYNLKMSLNGLFRMNPKTPWFKVHTIQFNYLPKPTRLFMIKARMLGILSMTGKDIYIAGKGNMKGTLMRFKTIFDERGKEYDISEFTTFLNDLVLSAPAGLIAMKDHLKWIEIDSKTVELTFSDQYQTVKAQLHFNELGQLINFTTTDRFYEEKDENGHTKYIQSLWETPIDSYQEINGLLLPYEVRAIWHMKIGEFCYAKFQLDKLEYNISK